MSFYNLINKCKKHGSARHTITVKCDLCDLEESLQTVNLLPPSCSECPCLRDPCTVDRESPICIERIRRFLTNSTERPSDTNKIKLPSFETINQLRLNSKDPTLNNITKKQLRTIYDLIEQQ